MNELGAPAASKQSWLVRDVFYVLALYLMLYYLYRFIERSIAGSNNPGWEVLLCREIVSAALLAALPIFYVVNWYRTDIEEMGITFGTLGRNLWAGLLSGLLLFAFVSALGAGVKAIWGPVPINPFLERLRQSDSLSSYSVTLLGIVVLAPISEEIYYRGFVYTIFRKRYGRIVGLIISSVLFACLHFNLFAAAQLFVTGIGLALLFELSGSLIPSTVAHLVFNVLGTFAGLQE